MKIKFHVLFFLLNFGLLSAQNSNNCDTPIPNDFVINGGFEQVLNNVPPIITGQLPLACNWISNSNLGTPDYFHSNSTQGSGVSIPDNNFGDQAVNPLFGGHAYAGFGVQLIDNEVRTEIIATQLQAPLQGGTNYVLSFDVSQADDQGKNPIIFQAFLGNFWISTQDHAPIPTTNGILLTNNNGFSNNTTGWDRISIPFTTGAGGQQFLYIGGFANTTFQNPDATGFLPTYYYIDNVTLVEANNCPACNTTQSAQLQDNLWSTLQEVDGACGEYSFIVPRLDECYDIVIDWGDGQTDVVSTADSGTVVSHQYTSDGNYSVCTQVFVDNVACGPNSCRQLNSTSDDCCPLISEAELSFNTSTGYVLSWEDIPNATYTLEFIVDYSCFSSPFPPLDGNTGTFTTTNNFISLSHDVTPVTGGRSWRYRIKTGDDCEWTEWCCVAYGRIDTSCDSTSDRVNHIANRENILVYPNPASNEISIATDKTNITSIEIYNIHGTLVKSVKEIKALQHTLDVTRLKIGYYIIKITLLDGTTQYKNLILK